MNDGKRKQDEFEDIGREAGMEEGKAVCSR